MSDQVRVNGNVHSWGSIVLKLDGERYYGFDSVAYSDKRTRVKGYGMGRHQAPRHRSRGKYEVDPVKLRGTKASVQIFREALAAKSPDGVSYGDVEFEVMVQYIDTGEAPITVEIESCVWAENTSSDEESGDPLKEEFAADPMRIRRNGLTLFDSSEGTP
jgi:hypothetical protein